MSTPNTNGNDSRLSFWRRVRDYAVPQSMIETATARRQVGDWAGACAAAHFDVDIDIRSVVRSHGRELADQVRTDLRHLAPDLLRWHMPRIAPDGLLRPGTTVALARYDPPDQPTRGFGTNVVTLVARTAPAWADAGQRIGLALWEGHRAGLHPHQRPHRRFRLDLHRHLWDARRTDELRVRAGVDDGAGAGRIDADPPDSVPAGCAVHRWAAEAAILGRAEGRPDSPVRVRLGPRRAVVLSPESDGAGAHAPRIMAAGRNEERCALPVLPDAATWTLPDLELLRAGVLPPDRLHPLVAAALVPRWSPGETCGPRAGTEPFLVECRGERHRLGVVDGVLTALDHDPAEIRREELLVALNGSPLPCLRAIDRAHRHPDCLTGVRERLDHGDTAGALAVIEGLLGPGAVLRDGPLREAFAAVTDRRVTYGLFRAGVTGFGPPADPPARRRTDHRAARRAHPRHATFR